MSGVGAAVVILLEIIQMAIVIRAIISWIPVPKDNPLIRLLYQVTEPVLGPIRHLIENSPLGKNMMIDLSPIIAFFLLAILSKVLAGIFGIHTYLM